MCKEARPVVDGDDLIGGGDHLGVKGANDGVLDNLGPLLAAHLAGILVDGLLLRLAHLKHERPVGARLGFGALRIAGITLRTPQPSVLALG